MRSAALLLSLLSLSASAQFLPRKTTVQQTINLETGFGVDTMTANVFDGGYLNITGAAAIGDDLSVGGEFACTEDAAFTAGVSVGGVSTLAGVDAGYMVIPQTIHAGNSIVSIPNASQIDFGDDLNVNIGMTGAHSFRIYNSANDGLLTIYGAGGLSLYSTPGSGITMTRDSRIDIRGDTRDDGGTSLVNVRVSPYSEYAWTLPGQSLFEVCNGLSGCSDGPVFKINPFGDMGAKGDAGIAGGVSVGGLVYALGFQAGASGVQPSPTGGALTWFQKTTHAALNLASVGDGDCSALTTETVTGAALGDACLVASGIALEAGGFLTCAVTNTDEAKWQLCNNSGGAIDHAEDTFTIRVMR